MPSVTVLKSWSEITNISAGYSSENTLKPILILNWQMHQRCMLHRGYNNNKAVSPSSLICPQFVVSCVSCWCGNVFWAWLNRTTKVLCRLSVLQLRLLLLHHIRFFPRCVCVYNFDNFPRSYLWCFSLHKNAFHAPDAPFHFAHMCRLKAGTWRKLGPQTRGSMINVEK